VLTATELEGKLLYPLGDVLESEPLASTLGGLKDAIAEAMDRLFFADPSFAWVDNGWLGSATLVVSEEVELSLPGLDSFAVVLGSGQGVSGFNLEVELVQDPVLTSFRVGVQQVEIKLRIGSDILRPVKPGTQEVDQDARGVDISLGAIDLTLDDEGPHFDFNAALSIPPCMIGSTGIILQIKQARWLTRSSENLPPNMPADFTGLFLDDVEVTIPGLPGTFRLDDAFIGTGGFSGKISETGLALTWDSAKKEFQGDLAGGLFGFQGGLKEVSLEFRQSMPTGCSITGDVFIPYLEKRVGLTLGLTGGGGLTAAAGVPFSTSTDPNDQSAAEAPGADEYLISVKLGDFFEFDVATLKFEVPFQGPAAVELSGRTQIKFSEKTPPISFKGLRIDSGGNVSISGGWLDLDRQELINFNGFSLEISRIGFGVFDDGRHWIGLNGGLHLAQGLPMGASVEGLRLSWDPKASRPFDTLSVSLDGIGLELTVQNVFSFAGEVAFFNDDQGKGFRGHVKLSLIQLKLTVDAEIVVGRSNDGITFFYFYLSVDLPTGIPLGNTGAAFFGFQGLLARHMAPNKRADEEWYYGWYLRSPKGATSGKKWGYERDAFAVGLGTTIGTNSDNGFIVHARVLLVIVLPGPRLLLEGKGNFIKQRGDSTMEGTFEALLALDFCAQLFQFNLAVTFKIQDLLDVTAGTDIAFSWAPTPPADWWHVYMGQKNPPEKRCRANLLSIVQGYSYFQLWRNRMLLGAWIGIEKDWKFGPVHAWVKASLEGEADVRYIAVPPSTERAIQFEAYLRLSGGAGLEVFGAGLSVLLDAQAMAKGPAPWFLSMNVHLEIRIDLWIDEWSWEKDLPLTWGDESVPLPQPVQPIVARIAWEHPKVMERADDRPAELEGAVIPPDARPVIIFDRPVRDLPGLGAPGIPNLAAEEVGKRKFSYQLHHLVLVRKDSRGEHLVGASGVLKVSRGLASLQGVSTLPDTGGSMLNIGEYPNLRVISNQNGQLVLSAPLPDGDYAYRMTGPLPKASVTIISASFSGYGTAEVTLGADPGLEADICAGGLLGAGDKQWTVVTHQGTTVVVRVEGDMPAAGAATLRALKSSTLEGVWLPAKDQQPEATKLMLGAKTPFTYFRNSFTEVIEGFDLHNPDYACGPQAEEEPICANFDDLPLGVLAGPFATELLTGEAQGENCVVMDGLFQAKPCLGVGVRYDQSWNGSGTVTLGFEPAVERVWVHCRTDEGGEVEVWSRGKLLGSAWVPHGQSAGVIDFSGEIDTIVIKGSLVYCHRVCFLPGWTCVDFDEQSFPQQSTGRQSYAGLYWDTPGTMLVTNGQLKVEPPPAKKPASKRKVIDMTALWSRQRFKVWPLIPENKEMAPRVIGIPWKAAVLEQQGRPLYIPGVGLASLASTRPNNISGRLNPSVDFDLPDLPDLPDGPLKPPQVTLVSLSIDLPQPVTRVLLDLGWSAFATAYAGSTVVDSAHGQSGGTLILRARSGWIGRVVLVAPFQLVLKSICYDAGEFGWLRFEQWSWRNSTLHSIEAFYQEDPVLQPGDYRLDVITAWDDENDSRPPETSLTSAQFTVGPPPGLGAVAQPQSRPGEPSPGTAPQKYPEGGPLADLRLYVAKTLPADGQRPFYRSYDLSIEFNENYITRMYLGARAPLSIRVFDSSGQERRPAAPVVWGSGHTVALSAEEVVWTKTLHNDGSRRCASIDMEDVVRDERASLGSGELMAPAMIHTGIVSSAGKNLYRFEFTTSRYADFRSQINDFDGQCRAAAGEITSIMIPSAVFQARQQQADVLKAYSDALDAINTGNPPAAEFEKYHLAQDSLVQAQASLRLAEQQAFEYLWSQCSLGGIADLPDRLEVSALSGGFVLQSPEPMHFERLSVTVDRCSAPPLRQRQITFGADFGGPDMGDFSYAGLEWSTNLELEAKNGAMRTRLAQPWTLTLKVSHAVSVEIDLTLEAGVTATLHGQGTAVLTDASATAAGGSQATTLMVTAAKLDSVTLSGSGISVSAIRLVELFMPVPASGPLRLIMAKFPANAADTRHTVDMLAYEDTDLTGWTIRGHAAFHPEQTFIYRVFSGGTLKANRVARIYAGMASGMQDSGVDLYFGGLSGNVPSEGAVLQLVDPNGKVRHETALLPNSAYVGEYMAPPLPNSDHTKAFILAGAPLQFGYWRIKFNFARHKDSYLPILTVGGSSEPEVAEVRLLAGHL